jgi:hypothetical protein
MRKHATPFPLQSSDYAICMAKRKPAPQSDALIWTQGSSVSRSRSGWQIISYIKSLGPATPAAAPFAADTKPN